MTKEEHIKSMTSLDDDEINKLCTYTLHGDLPRQTVSRMMATIAEVPALRAQAASAQPAKNSNTRTRRADFDALELGPPGSAEELCSRFGITIVRGEVVAGDIREYAYMTPTDGFVHRDHATSVEEAATSALNRMRVAIEKFLYRNETREQRIERLSRELVRALGVYP